MGKIFSYCMLVLTLDISASVASTQRTVNLQVRKNREHRKGWSNSTPPHLSFFCSPPPHLSIFAHSRHTCTRVETGKEAPPKRTTWRLSNCHQNSCLLTTACWFSSACQVCPGLNGNEIQIQVSQSVHIGKKSPKTHNSVKYKAIWKCQITLPNMKY